jgi:iron(III) transport system substrate-binding protein
MRGWPILVALILILSAPSQARVFEYPPLKPADERGNGADAARVVIYSTMDIEAAEPLLAGFRGTHPHVAITYHDLNSIELYDRFLSEVESGQGSADLLFSSAMDLQMKLVNDGYARAYESPEAAVLPPWAVWRNEAFGVTFEPAVMVYNRDLVPAADVPKTRFDLAALLREKPKAYFGRVATYDPERSGLGFLFATQDAEQSNAIWTLLRGFGVSGVKLYSTTGAILERIVSGRFAIAYNLLGSYARARAKDHPNLGIVLPTDYTLVMSRIALIPKRAPHPRAAEMFLDFLLSEMGQRIIADKAQLYSIHPNVTGEATAAGLRKSVGDRLRPIRVGPGLLVYLDQAKRQKFFRQWQRALGGR